MSDETQGGWEDWSKQQCGEGTLFIFPLNLLCIHRP